MEAATQGFTVDGTVGHDDDDTDDLTTQVHPLIRRRGSMEEVANPRRRRPQDTDEPPRLPPSAEAAGWGQAEVEDGDIARFFFQTGLPGQPAREVAVHTYCLGAAVRFDESSNEHYAGFAFDRVDEIHTVSGPVDVGLPPTENTGELTALVTLLRQALSRDEAHIQQLNDRAEEARRERILHDQARSVDATLARADTATVGGAAASPPQVKQEGRSAATRPPRALDELRLKNPMLMVAPPPTLVVRTANAWILQGARRGILDWLRAGFDAPPCPMAHRALWLDYWELRKKREEVRHRFMNDYAPLDALRTTSLETQNAFCHQATQILAVRSHRDIQAARNANCVAANGALTAARLAKTLRS